MQTSEPIRTAQWLSIQTCSPSQTWSPSSRNQGYLTVTRGLITRPWPTRAPNRRRSAAFQGEGRTSGLWNRSALQRYQAIRQGRLRLPAMTGRW